MPFNNTLTSWEGSQGGSCGESRRTNCGWVAQYRPGCRRFKMLLEQLHLPLDRIGLQGPLGEGRDLAATLQKHTAAAAEWPAPTSPLIG